MIQIINYQDKISRFIDPADVKVCSNYLLFYEELPTSRSTRLLARGLAKYKYLKGKK